MAVRRLALPEMGVNGVAWVLVGLIVGILVTVLALTLKHGALVVF